MSIGHLNYICSFKTNPTKGLSSPRQADSLFVQMLFLESLFVGLVTVVVEFTYVCRERG